MNYVPSDHELRAMDLGDDDVPQERINCEGCQYLIVDDCGRGMGPFQSEPHCWESE